MKLNLQAISDFITNPINFDRVYELVTEINEFNYSLDHIYYDYNNEDFFETFFGYTINAVKAVCDGDYSYTDEYVRFDSNDNLVSANKFEVFADFVDNKEDIINSIECIYEIKSSYLDLPECFFLN